MILRKRNSVVIIVLLAAAIFLREMDTLHFGFYKSILQTRLKCNWTDKSITISIDSSMMLTKFSNSQFSGLPIIILYQGDTLYKEQANGLPIRVSLNTFNPGFLWMPIYKSTNFSATGTAIFKNEIIKTAPTKIKLVKADLEGHLVITGSISITGFCSHRMAKQLVRDAVVKNIVTEVKRYFLTLD